MLAALQRHIKSRSHTTVSFAHVPIYDVTSSGQGAGRSTFRDTPLKAVIRC